MFRRTASRPGQSTPAHAESLADLEAAAPACPTPYWNRRGFRLAIVCSTLRPFRMTVCPIGSRSRCISKPIIGPTGRQALTFDLTLRQFGVALGDTGRRSQPLAFDSVDVTSTQEVQVNDRATLLLTFRQAGKSTVVRELVWQQGDVMIEILSQSLNLRGDAGRGRFLALRGAFRLLRSCRFPKSQRILWLLYSHFGSLFN